MIYAAATIATGRVISTAPVAAAAPAAICTELCGEWRLYMLPHLPAYGVAYRKPLAGGSQ